MPVLTEVMLRANKYKYPATQVEHGGRLYFKFEFNRTLLEEIKNMEGRQWHGPDREGNVRYPIPPEVKAMIGTIKLWSVPMTQRNLFQLEWLKGGSPYTPWKQPLIDLSFNPRETSTGLLITPYTHQQELTRFFLTRHYCIGAAEMGTGKTFAVILAMELAGLKGHEVYYIAPRSALRAVERELRFWKSKVYPQLMTYEEAVKLHKLWEIEGRPTAPKMLVVDESQRVKNHTAQRSQAVKYIADYVREDWGKEGYVILMSGSPAPKAPTDWYNQCEIACPGFLREGTFALFRDRLGLIVQKENAVTGGSFPQLVTWRDSDNKCLKCGQPKEIHDLRPQDDLTDTHPFTACKNEVAFLYERMKGLVMVKYKKDCLSELPDKIYRIIKLKPKAETLRAAKLINSTGRTVVEKLTLLRELSDGFQYVEKRDGDQPCPRCSGSTQCIDWYDPADPDGEGIDFSTGIPDGIEKGRYIERAITCPMCDKGRVPRFVQSTEQVFTPKEDAFREILDEHEDCGRLVVYAGFQGSVDRCVQIAQSEKWVTIRWDGRGVEVLDEEGKRLAVDPLELFQDKVEQYPRVCFIGQPGAAGVGITLTRSPTILYWSNDFNAENRIQSEDRIHRPGMDIHKGATIIDLVHLPSDERVLVNLKEKRRLQDMTMSGIDWEANYDV